MKFSLRFVLPLTVVLVLFAVAVLPRVDALAFNWFLRDMEERSQIVSRALNDPLAEALATKNFAPVRHVFEQGIQGERLFALGLCDEQERIVRRTTSLPPEIHCDDALVANATWTLQRPGGSLHVLNAPVLREGRALGRVLLVQDMNFVKQRSADVRRLIIWAFAILALVIVLITTFVAELSLRGIFQGVRTLFERGREIKPESEISDEELRPLANDLRELMREWDFEHRSKDEDNVTWNAQALRDLLKADLSGEEILILSNREPYIHVRKGDRIETQVPASGLVTALEPVMRACSGTWIAHGSGSADRETVDEHDRVQVPPENPSYRIRRVWMTAEEEQGYYYGFANEGLWPLCHIAHTRPIFRSDDWQQYVAVNRRFAEAVVAEARTQNPVVLVQDYHLALAPKMIRDALPNATIISFWHIPWPNPEVFGICPWREEILEGMLGSSIMGFHTRFHCNNFLDSIDRFLETRIERDASSVHHGGQITAVKHYPISIEWPSGKGIPPAAECREEIRRAHGLAPAHCLGIGVDRMDYTKGIIERFLAVERLLELYPQWLGKFTFVQIGAPTRSTISHYVAFNEEVARLAARINQRFGNDGYQPIVLKAEHHGPAQISRYFRASEVCVVSSLHDGMNLVAKEFAAARDDERGVLVLSQFAGAVRELPEALIINPYDIDQFARTIHHALQMPDVEQRERMRSMRGLLREFNVFRWAGRMLMDAARLRRRSRLGRRIRASNLAVVAAR